MKQIWAPWRMDYIRGVKDGKCFLCEMFSQEGSQPDLIAKRGASCAVVLNRYPYTNGHLMIAPYRHISDLSELTTEEQTEMMALTAECTQALKKIMMPHGFNIGINMGEVAGAGLKDHIHLHVVPRWSGDTNFMPVFADVKIIPQALQEVRELLIAEFTKTAE